MDAEAKYWKDKWTQAQKQLDVLRELVRKPVKKKK